MTDNPNTESSEKQAPETVEETEKPEETEPNAAEETEASEESVQTEGEKTGETEDPAPAPVTDSQPEEAPAPDTAEEPSEKPKRTPGVVDESLYEEFVDEKEEKKTKEKKKFSVFRLVFLLICIGVFLYSMSNILKLTPDDFKTGSDTDAFRKERLEYEKQQKEQEQASQQPGDPSGPVESETSEGKINPSGTTLKKRLVFDETDGEIAFLTADLKPYEERNPDTVAWLKISDSTGKVTGLPIDLPVVQRAGEYYLDHNFNGKTNINGWVFLDERNDEALLSDNRNAILYGHARSDNMFGGLKYLNEKPKWYKNPENHYIQIKTETEDMVWQIFSWYEASVKEEMESEYYYYRTDFPSDEFFVDFCNRMQEKNTIETFSQFEFTPEDRILTLQTCKSYDEDIRVVVHAKLVKLQVWE